MPADRSRPARASVQVTAVLLLPALFAVLGGWEIVRGTSTIADFAQSRDRAAAQLERVQALARTDPQATVQFPGDAVFYAAPLAATMIADGLGDLATDLVVARTRLPFAWLAVVAASLSLVAGLAGLFVIEAAARRSRRSRAALVRAFGQVRRLVPFALGLQVLGVALALLGSVFFECGGLWFIGLVSGGEIQLVAMGLGGAGLALFGAFSSTRQLRRAFGLFRPRPARVLGLPLAEADAPGLFALVGQLAREQEAVMPQTVVAGAVDGFFVTSVPVALPSTGTVMEGRTLHVSLPQLAVLSRAETRAVLAHELAHFSGEDTQYSVQFQPVYAALQQSVMAVAGRPGSAPIVDRLLRPAAALGGYVLGRFDRAVQHWNRLREFEADRCSLLTEAADALATSMLRAAVTGEIVEAQLRAMFKNPAGAPDDFVAQTLRIAATQGFIEPGTHLSKRQPHPTDTHPPTAQRIEAAGVPIDDGLLARAARPVDAADLAEAEALFEDWLGLCRAVTSQLVALAAAQEQERLVLVEAAADAVGDAPVELFERRGPSIVRLSLAALISCGAGALLWLMLRAGQVTDPPDGTDTILLWGIVASGAVAVLACVGLVRLLRPRAPFLVLTTDGVSSPGFVGQVPWLAVAGVGVAVGRGVTTSLFLAPERGLPARTGRIWRLRHARRRHALLFRELTPKGLKPADYLALLQRYRIVALARADLADRQRRAPPPGQP